MSYLASDRIQVFPYGNDRGSVDPYARILNEQNIRSLIKSVVDHNSYVINYDRYNNIIEFVIDGYYFKADFSFDTGLLYNKDLWATIKLRDVIPDSNDLDSSIAYQYLMGGDVDNIFEGVEFSNDTPQPGKIPVDLIASPSNNYRYKGCINSINNTDTSSTLYSYCNAATAATSNTIEASAVGITNGQLTISGWALINVGQKGLYVSIDNKNWHHVPGAYSDATEKERNAAKESNANLTNISSSYGKFNSLKFDLTKLNMGRETITKDVYLAVGNNNSPETPVCLLATIKGVNIPCNTNTIIENYDNNYTLLSLQLLKNGDVPSSSYVKLSSSSVEGSQPDIIYCGTSTDVV